MANDSFFATKAWWKLRSQTLASWRRSLKPCGICGKPLDWVGKGAVHVDHILPRREHPELALSPANLMCLHDICHNSVKKRMEAGKEVRRYGLDGWPI